MCDIPTPLDLPCFSHAPPLDIWYISHLNFVTQLKYNDGRDSKPSLYAFPCKASLGSCSQAIWGELAQVVDLHSARSLLGTLHEWSEACSFRLPKSPFPSHKTKGQNWVPVNVRGQAPQDQRDQNSSVEGRANEKEDLGNPPANLTWLYSVP